MIITITLKALSVCAVYIIDRIKPLTICKVRVIPSKNPIFHMKEMEEGEGRSISDFFSRFVIGFVLNSWFFIKMMRKLFVEGDDHVLR